jgi:hypothetical protein
MNAFNGWGAAVVFAIAVGGLVFVLSIVSGDAAHCGPKRIFDTQTHTCIGPADLPLR